MRFWSAVFALLWLAPPCAAHTAASEDQGFSAAARFYRNAGADKTAAIDAFQRFVDEFPHASRAADAEYAIGDAQLARAMGLLDADADYVRDRLNARMPDGAQRAFQAAAKAYQAALKKAPDDGLRATAAYRLGEVAYDQRDFAAAAKRFEDAARQWPRSYVAPRCLLGLAYARLALGDFPGAQEAVARLARDFPDREKAARVRFVEGVLALHSGDYPGAEKKLSSLDTEQARYFLGRTYLLWGRPLLAATLFNKLADAAKDGDIKEAAAFFLGDAFFLSHDYDGAIDKYRSFVRSYPFSRFKVAALYRIGSSAFEKKSYGEARLSFGSLVSQFPSDYYATLARYFIGESYLVNDQMREALFAYTDVLSNGRKDLRPQALYRLAWTQQSLGDSQRAVQTSQLFLDSYPTHPLAKDVYLILGNSLDKIGQFPQALEAFQRILDIAPGSEVAEQALFLMLKQQYDRKSYASILTSYQYLLHQLPPSRSKWRALSYLTAAETYLRLNRVEEARALYDTVLKEYPADAAGVYAQDGLAWCDQLSGRDKEAVADRQKLKEMLQTGTATFTFAAINDLGIADSFYAQKDYQDAYAFYDKFAGEHPQDPAAAAALYRAGFALYRMKYYGQAVETWQKLVAAAPDSPQARKASDQIADTLFRARKFPEAAAAYQKILAAAPNGERGAVATLRLAQIAYYANQDDEALAQVKRLVADFPKSSEITDGLDLAEAVFDRDPKRDARAYFKDLIAAAPDGAAAGEMQFRMARRLYDARDYQGAATELESFSVNYTEHPSLPKAQFMLGECYFHLERYADAAAAYDRYVQNYPDEADTALALFRLGSAYYSEQAFEKAIPPYERLVSDFPKSDYLKPTLFNLALAYKAAGQADRAQTTYARYVALSGDDQSGMNARWEIYSLEKGKKDYAGATKTLGEIEAAAKPGSDDAFNAVYQQGDLAFSQGDRAGAVKAWVSLAAMKPDDDPYRLQALVRLSEVYEKASDWKHAIQVYRDLADHAGKADMAAAARDRIKELVKMNPTLAKEQN